MYTVKEASMPNSVDQEQTAPIGAVCSGSTLFASILNSSVMLGNYLQQTTSADDIFRCIFSCRFEGYFIIILTLVYDVNKYSADDLSRKHFQMQALLAL